MKKVVTLIFLTIFVETVYGQTEQKLSVILNKIKRINEVQYEHIGIAGTPSDNFKNYLDLKSKASERQLLKLTYDSNAVVACYASWALVDKLYKDLPTIFNRFLNKDKIVPTFSGCIKSEDYLSNEFYHRFWNSISPQLRPANRTLFSLDSLILYNDKSYWMLTVRALENRVYSTSFNAQIEYLAFTKINMDAIKYLQNLKDKTYDEAIKQSLIKYFQETNFRGVGIDRYLSLIKELLNYNDETIRPLVVTKLKNDSFWRPFEKEFLEVINKYNIQSTEVK